MQQKEWLNLSIAIFAFAFSLMSLFGGWFLRAIFVAGLNVLFCIVKGGKENGLLFDVIAMLETLVLFGVIFSIF